MIGAAPRPHPPIKVRSYDPVRLAFVQTVDRERVIEAIAAHLFIVPTDDQLSMQEKYGAGSGPYASQPQALHIRRLATQ